MTERPWVCWKPRWPGDFVQVIPAYDAMEHEMENEQCGCNSRVREELNNQKIVVHNALDGREYFESGVERAWKDRN